MENVKIEHNSFGKRLRSMLKVDFRRMFTMPLFYIMTGICLVIPILILVMTTMMDGSVTVDPQKRLWRVLRTYGRLLEQSAEKALQWP